ncbi:hypothetical protein AN191_13975 [Loktanella sp. 5RATIMAR09]|nr:hypothetical protein AN191_13975 [Loktanella sp. 5RATIMAR09]
MERGYAMTILFVPIAFAYLALPLSLALGIAPAAGLLKTHRALAGCALTCGFLLAAIWWGTLPNSGSTNVKFISENWEAIRPWYWGATVLYACFMCLAARAHKQMTAALGSKGKAAIASAALTKSYLVSLWIFSNVDLDWTL